MIEIDIPTDLGVVDDDGLVRGSLRRDRALVRSGEVVIAGSRDRWSWARVVAVERMVASLQLITEEQASELTSLVAPPSPSVDWPWPRIPWLRLEQHTFTTLDEHTYMWVQHFAFSIDPDLADRELIAALISSHEYAHDFASPYGYGADVGMDGRPIHARWIADLLKPEMFVPVAAVEARKAVHAWMDDAVTEPPQTARTHDRVDGVLARAIERGAVYRLEVPVDEELVHDYGWVVGVSGFHEYVSIDRDREAMHLVIASDD